MKKKRTMDEEDIENVNPYEVDKLSKIPSGLILEFAKFWAAAAAVFFILIGGRGIGFDFSTPAVDGYQEMARTIVSIVMVALFLAVLLNYGIKHFAHLMLNRRNDTRKWMILNLKGFLGFLAYLAYCLVCMIIEFFIISFLGKYGLIPTFLDNNGAGIEPFSYGLVFLLIDGVFLVAKNYIVKLIQYLTYKKQIQAA